MISKNNIRSRNSAKFCTLGSDQKKSLKTFKNNGMFKQNSLFKENPVRMYNTIEDVHLIPELEEAASIEEVDRIGPESFTPIQLLGKGSFGEVYLVQ